MKKILLLVFGLACLSSSAAFARSSHLSAQLNYFSPNYGFSINYARHQPRYTHDTHGSGYYNRGHRGSKSYGFSVNYGSPAYSYGYRPYVRPAPVYVYPAPYGRPMYRHPHRPFRPHGPYVRYW